MISNPRYLVAVAAIISIGMSGCSQVRSDFGGSPESTVKAFYEHLNKAEYSKAKELYTREARQMVDGQLMAMGGGFAKWGEHETKGGTIKEVSILSSDVRGEGAKVLCRITFIDGSAVTKSVFLTKEDGSWRMGLIE